MALVSQGGIGPHKSFGIVVRRNCINISVDLSIQGPYKEGSRVREPDA